MMKEVATITLALAFIIHVSSIINNLLYPDLPTFKHYSKNLKDIDFPIAFRICAEKLQDEEQKFNSVGYQNMFDFFLGRSMHGHAYGWAGHSENGSIIGPVEGHYYFSMAWQTSQKTLVATKELDYKILLIL